MRIWRDLLEVARFAPSPWNTQPWRLRVLSELQAELCYEPACLRPVADPEGRLTTVALGIVTESLSIAGAPRGFEVRGALRGEQPWATSGAPVPFARLLIAQRQEPEPLPPSLIRARRTSRLPFDGIPADEATIAGLAAVASAGGHRLGASSTGAVVGGLLDLHADAVVFRAETDRLRTEDAGWLRFGESAAVLAGDGLSPGCLGPSGRQLRRLYGLSALALLPGSRGRARAAVRESMAGTGTVVWLGGPCTTLDEWFRAGRMLCRLWLTATAHGLYLHPLDSLVSDAAVAARLPEPVRGAETPWLVARVGTGREPARSLRHAVDRLLVDRG